MSPPASALGTVIRYPDQGRKCHWVWDSSVFEQLALLLCPQSAGVKLLVYSKILLLKLERMDRG